MTSVLIIGCGSIGGRHLRCFLKTGRCTVAACDANPTLLDTMRQDHGVACHASLDEALEQGGFHAAVICTPAHLHLPMARRLLERRMHLLIEKPLATSLDQVPETRAAIQQAGSHVSVAYVYHVMPWIAAARAFLRSGELGRVLHGSVVCGQHFPTFRPAYRDIYYARHEHGGGAVQDALTHVVNAVEWMTGPCTRLFADAAHQMLEGVTVEDTVNVSARHGGALIQYALNQFQAPNELNIELHAEHGSVKIEGHHRRWGVFRRGGSDWTWHETPPLERDDLFTAQAHAFLDGIESRECPLSSFEEAVQTLKFNQAALRSIRSGLPITLE